MDKLQKIVLVIPKGELVLSSVAGSYKLFRSAIEESRQEVELLIAGYEQKQDFFEGLFSVHPDLPFHRIDTADLIIIPAIESDIEIAIKENQALISWLKQQYVQGAHLASLCSASFLLASAGLLQYRRCTTHWAYMERFLKLFPNTHFLKHNIITEDERIFTSGGAFTFLNLIVYLIERFFGKEIAKQMIGAYQIDYNRKSQAQFVLFSTQKNHEDTAIIRAQQYIEEHFAEKLSIKEIAAVAKLHERTLARRFKALCGNTPNQYLQRVRIEKAKEMLSQSNMQIGEIQYHIGYNDPKSFREIFTRLTGISPMAYRSKYKLYV